MFGHTRDPRQKLLTRRSGCICVPMHGTADLHSKVCAGQASWHRAPTSTTGRCPRSRATPGCRTEHLPAPRRLGRTTTVGSTCATSWGRRSADGRPDRSRGTAARPRQSVAPTARCAPCWSEFIAARALLLHRVLSAGKAALAHLGSAVTRGVLMHARALPATTYSSSVHRHAAHPRRFVRYRAVFSESQRPVLGLAVDSRTTSDTSTS